MKSYYGHEQLSTNTKKLSFNIKRLEGNNIMYITMFE